MTSPDDKDPVRSELEYAPPWVREQVAREKGTREQAPREQTPREQGPREPAPREQMTRDQFRATLPQSAGAAIEQLTQNNPESRSFGDDRPWHQRALEPELVPAPPAGSSNLWLMLRLGAVCGVAALVAAVVVFLFNPKQIAHKIAGAKCRRRRRAVFNRTLTRCPGSDRRNIGRRDCAANAADSAGAGRSCDDAAAWRGTGRRTAATTGKTGGARSAGAAARIASGAELNASRWRAIAGAGHKRAGAAAGRHGAPARSGPNRTGSSRSAERRQARSCARPK